MTERSDVEDRPHLPAEPEDVTGVAGTSDVAETSDVAGTADVEGPDRGGRDWRWLAVPLMIFAVTRAVQLVILGWLVAPDTTMRDRLLSWDGGWFIRVAQEGYPHTYSYDGNGQLVGNGLAFFPVYPLLVRGLHVVTGLGFDSTALIIAWLGAALAAIGIHALGDALYDKRVAAAFTVLFCVQPMSIVLSMAYSESVFLALVAGTLVAAYRKRWLLAGVLGLAAGLTRPTGAALILALGVAAVLHVADRDNGPRRWWALGSAALAGVSVPAYLAWVGLRVGEPTAWFKIQTAGWGTRFDFGVAAATFLRDTFKAADGWVQVSVALLLIAVVVAAVLAVRLRVWPPLVVYGLVALVLVLGQAGYYHSKPRLLVPVLLTLVPAAIGLGRVRARTATVVLIGFGLFGLWYGAYLITVWRYAI